MTLALQQRATRLAAPPAGDLLVQRKSGLAAAPPMAAPAIVDSGRPLDNATRTTMESGFGQDFSAVRVHDDARAHDNARNLDARAYAAGNHIVFGEGAYRPETPQGQGLIAHELAHTVQQGGVQMKANAPMVTGADSELEVQADSAAAAVTAGRQVPALSRIGTPAVFRNPATAPAPTAEVPATKLAKTKNINEPDLPSWVTDYSQDDPASKAPFQLTVYKDVFDMPLEKGGGTWVGALYASKSNFVSTIFPKQNFSVFKEGSATSEYRDMWLGNYGFKTTSELVTAITTAKASKPAISAIVDAEPMKSFLESFKHPTSGLKNSKSAVDHIIEKHMGGTSNPENLQLFDGARNSASGGQSAKDVAALARALAAPGMRGANAQNIQIVFAKVITQPPGAQDPTYHIENMLRTGQVTGSAVVKSAAAGKSVRLVAGLNAGQTNLKDSGATLVEGQASRVVSGANLEEYTRTAGANSPPDKIKATLDNGALRKLKLSDKDSSLTVTATKIDTPAVDPAQQIGGAAAAVPAETRKLSIASGPANIGFFYPNMSPGYLTSLVVKEDGLHGTGIINPTIPLLPKKVDIEYGPTYLNLLTKLDKSKLTPPMPGFRFTEGELKIALAPAFVPSGKIGFSIGPETKPVIIGEFNASYQGGAFIATGDLKLGETVPGISGATGQLAYHSDNGWSGKLNATTSSLPKSTAEVEIGFRTVGGHVQAYGFGKLTTTIKEGGVLSMTAGFSGTSGIAYAGNGTIPSPLPGVDSVFLTGSYRNGELDFTGTIAADKSPKWRGFDAGLTVRYRKKDGEDGRFSGKVSIAKKGILNGKGDIAGDLGYAEDGKFTGSGRFSYQVTSHFRPELDFTLFESGRLRVKGTANVQEIELFKAWPDPANQKKTILKGGVSISIPIPPMPALQATLSVTGELGASFVVGPGLLGGSMTAELYPFETDPKIKASLDANFRIPAKADLYGRFGALLGVEVAGGLLGVEGGLYLDPTIGVRGEGGIKSTFDYAEGGFSFAADAYATGVMEGTLGISLVAAVKVLRNLLRYELTHPLAKFGPKQIGPKLEVKLGKIGYARDGTVTWPSLSQISVTPKEFDPLELVKGILQDAKASPTPEPQERGPRDANRWRMDPGKI